MNIKIVTTLIIAAIVSNGAIAQSEPESVRGKELLEKMDRSEIEATNMDDAIGLDEEIPKMEMPKLEFKNNATKKPPEVKPAVKTPPVVQAPVEKAPVVKEPVAKVSAVKESDPESDKNRPKVKVNSDDQKRNKILISNRRLSKNKLEINDEITKTKDYTYVYRLVRSDTVQYVFTGILPINAPGLKSLGNNRYVVIDPEQLDENVKKVVAANKPVVEKAKPEPKKTETKKPEVKKVIATTKPAVTLSDVDAIKKEFEKIHNKERKISKTITLNKILKNDVIHISGEVQLLIRRNTSYKIEKYWLTEKLDINNPSIKDLSKNRYKVIKAYDSKK